MFLPFFTFCQGDVSEFGIVLNVRVPVLAFFDKVIFFARNGTNMLIFLLGHSSLFLNLNSQKLASKGLMWPGIAAPPPDCS